jgi:hypothetical protein
MKQEIDELNKAMIKVIELMLESELLYPEANQAFNEARIEFEKRRRAIEACKQ